MSGERHEKWQPIAEREVIPAGQPYRVELSTGDALEYRGADVAMASGSGVKTFVDSTWRPPLDLPTEPTWGFGVWDDGQLTWIARWRRCDGNLVEPKGHTPAGSLVDFIPLTDEQVARIEAAR